MSEMAEKYAERMARLDAAIALQKPDRIPFAPKVSLFYCTGYDVSAYDVMKDFRNAEHAVKAFIEEYDPDLSWAPSTYPIDPLEALQPDMLRWPGPTHGLSLNSSYQHLDRTYMEDDEFNEFLHDPTHFIITKLLPRKYKHLRGLEKIRLHQIYDMSLIMGLSAFSDSDVISALMTLAHAGRHVMEKKQQAAYIQNVIEKTCQCPIRGTALCAPFDIYADSLRGLVQSVMDVEMYPEETLACVERIAELCIDRDVEEARGRGEKFIFIPLHAGVDEFMSPKNYERFYWPTLKRLIIAITNAGMVPCVFCEGKYNTRLDVISDVPKGKVYYMFEQIADMKRVKDIVGKTACIGGNIPTATLAFGTPEQVIDKTRELIDICAPGGGFMMDCSIIIDNAKHENMRAWKDATLKYGGY